MIRNRRARNTTNNKQPEVLPGRFLESWVIDYPLTAMPEFSAFSAYSILGGGGGGGGGGRLFEGKGGGGGGGGGGTLIRGWTLLNFFCL